MECPEERVELSGLIELPVVELTSAEGSKCTNMTFAVYFENNW